MRDALRRSNASQDAFSNAHPTHATPTLDRRLNLFRQSVETRWRGALAALALREAKLRLKALRISAYAAVAIAVLALPGSAQSGATTTRAASAAPAPVARAQSLPEREVVTQQHPPLTVTRDGPPEVRTYEVQDGDNLVTIAIDHGVNVMTVAYNNGISDPYSLKPGQMLKIPPLDAAIYTVKAGDTVESVAKRFKTDVKSIMETNRLYFEPENFGAGKSVLVPVPDADFPDFKLKDTVVAQALTDRSTPQARRVTSAQVQAPIAHRLSWPVGGVITQYYWYGHTGVDIGAPFGSGIAAADDGVVSAEGWVPVGGLRVCLRHEWGMETCYYHMGSTYVDVGLRVKRGQVLGTVGLTGVTTGPHVHWEARFNGVLVNALNY